MAISSGASRSGGRVYAQTLIKGLTLVAFAIVALAPRAAEASIYVWKDVDGSWTNPNNWQPIDGGANAFATPLPPVP